jgi:spore germination protein PB
MILVVHQSIQIHMIRIDGISNASVFQIGAAGIVKPISQVMNSGGFTSPAPQIGTSGQTLAPYVPLVSPSM